MPLFTREQLRNFITNSADFNPTDYTFAFSNNLSTTAGFIMKGVNKEIFNSSSISDLENCKVVSGSSNAAFIIKPNTTSARFRFTPTSTISKDLIKFSSTNTLVYNINDRTSSGSVSGIYLEIAGGCTSSTWTGDLCVSYINSKGNPSSDDFIYDASSPYNGQPIWHFANNSYHIRWEGSMWELVHIPTGLKSTRGPGDLCSPAGVYTGPQVSGIVLPATAVEGACPP